MASEIFRKFASTRGAFVFFLGVAVVPGLAAGLLGIRYLQTNLFPIVTDFTLDQMTYDVHGDVVLSGSFKKSYPDWSCVYRDMNWYMPAKDASGDSIRFRVSSRFGDVRPKASNNNRHEGLNFFHDWTIGVSEYPKMVNLTGYVSHTCLWVIQTRTNFPVIRLPTSYARP